MDSGGDRVVRFVVNLWQSVVLVDGGFAQIPQRSGVDHITNDVLSDGFVLWDSAGGSFASDELDVSSALLVSACVPSLFGHFENWW